MNVYFIDMNYTEIGRILETYSTAFLDMFPIYATAAATGTKT